MCVRRGCKGHQIGWETITSDCARPSIARVALSPHGSQASRQRPVRRESAEWRTNRIVDNHHDANWYEKLFNCPRYCGVTLRHAELYSGDLLQLFAFLHDRGSLSNRARVAVNEGTFTQLGFAGWNGRRNFGSEWNSWILQREGERERERERERRGTITLGFWFEMKLLRSTSIRYILWNCQLWFAKREAYKHQRNNSEDKRESFISLVISLVEVRKSKAFNFDRDVETVIEKILFVIISQVSIFIILQTRNKVLGVY